MATTRTGELKAIFVEALDHAGDARQSFLDQACGNDEQLRAEVEAYLAAEDRAEGFLSQPDHLSQDLPGSPHEGIGSSIGRYTLLNLIGEGGFGSVFKAEQQKPVRRMVAMKIIKPGMDTRQVIARFETERQSLAELDHPNIARVFDAGQTDSGRPYFVMELVDGIPLTKYCDQNKLPVTARLKLFAEVCGALQHSHQKGIIHRDIKPSNILVAVYDGKPVPKLIDFGIAKATQSQMTESTLSAEFRQLIGTPAYMSPEQAEFGGPQVDTRSDIYSLGVLLYELLTGITPFDPEELRSASYPEILRIIRDVEPQKPSTRLGSMGDSLPNIAAGRGVDPRGLRVQIRGELDWIVIRAMEKDRGRRYESAAALARDINRYLEDQPVEACPPSAGYLVRKFLHRHRKPVSIVAVIGVLMAIGGVAYVVSLRAEQRRTVAAMLEARHQQRMAEDARLSALAAESAANAQRVASAILQARAGRGGILPGRRFDSLLALAEAAKIDPSLEVRSQAVGCLGLTDVQLRNEWAPLHEGLCFNHNLTLEAGADLQNGEVFISRVPQSGSEPGEIVLRLQADLYRGGIEFSPDDSLIAIAGADGQIRVYSSTDGRLALAIPSGPAFDFTPDGTALAVAKPGGPLDIYDLSSGKLRRRVQLDTGTSISICPNGERVATWNGYGDAERDIDVCDLASGAVTVLPHVAGVTTVGWHPSGNRLAVGSQDCDIYQWDLTDPTHPAALPTLVGHRSLISSLKFNHAGDLLASSTMSEIHTRLWDVASGEPVLCMNGATHPAFSSDDRLLAVAGSISSVSIVTPGRERRNLVPPFAGFARDAVFSPDGSIIACGGGKVVRFWNANGATPCVAPLDLPINGDAIDVAFSPDGTSCAVLTSSGLWRVPIVELPGGAKLPHGSAVRQLQIGPPVGPLRSFARTGDGNIRYSADGHHIALAMRGQSPRLLDPDDPSHDVLLSSPSTAWLFISVSPDLKWVAASKFNARNGPFVSVWDAHTGHVVCDLPIISSAVAFSPNGKWLLTGNGDECRLWEVGTWKPVRIIPTFHGAYHTICFSGDFRMLAVSSHNWGVQMLNPLTGAQLFTLDDLNDETPLAMSADGGQLLTCCVDGTNRLRDLRLIRQELAEMGLDWPGPPIPPRNNSRIELTLAAPAH